MIPCVLTPLGPLKLEADEPTPGFQPTIVPSSVAKRKRAGADVGLLFASTPEIMNPPWFGSGRVVILKTVPVGAPLLPMRSTGVGIPTTSGLMVTEFGALGGTLYSVATPAALSETQKGEPVGISVTPQGFSRFGSTVHIGVAVAQLWEMPFLSISGDLLTTRSVAT